MAPVTPNYEQGGQAVDVERQGQPYRAAAAPPGAYPEQSLPNAAYPTVTPSTYSYPPQEKLSTPSYQQPGYAVPPHAAGNAGYPVMSVGYPAAAVGANGQQAAVVVTTGGVVYSQTGNEPCECSAGWVLFGIGWIFPICWLIGAFLPCCSKNRNDRRAAIGSGIMLAVSVIVTVLCIVIPLTVMARVASASQDAGQYRSYH